LRGYKSPGKGRCLVVLNGVLLHLVKIRLRDRGLAAVLANAKSPIIVHSIVPAAAQKSVAEIS
jgi:hypothetical protein